MKKIITAFILISTAALYNTATAQKDKRNDKETQEIIIRKKGDAATDLRVEINGDKVIINGKPLSDFKDENITIKKGNIMIRDGEKMLFNFNDKDFMKGWEEGNTLSKAFLGVTTSDDDEGAKINKVTEGSAADKAGLQEGDIITKIDNKKVEGPSSLSEIITSYKPKDNVKIYYVRDGKEKNTKASLGQTKNAMAFSFKSPEGKFSLTMPRVPGAPPAPPMPPGANVEIWGDEFNNAMPRAFGQGNGIFTDIFPRHQKLGLKIQDTEEGNGIKVLGTDKDSPAEKAGLKKDDIVTEIAGKKINNTDDAREQLLETHDKSVYTIKANRNGTAMSFEIKIPKKLKTADL